VDMGAKPISGEHSSTADDGRDNWIAIGAGGGRFLLTWLSIFGVSYGRELESLMSLDPKARTGAQGLGGAAVGYVRWPWGEGLLMWTRGAQFWGGIVGDDGGR